jgi:hypothetical protein
LKIKADVYGHHGTLTQGTLAVGDHVDAQVDVQVRAVLGAGVDPFAGADDYLETLLTRLLQPLQG